jgi:hypothetical protein
MLIKQSMPTKFGDVFYFVALFFYFAVNLSMCSEARFDCYLSGESVVGRYGGSGKEKCEVIIAASMQHSVFCDMTSYRML